MADQLLRMIRTNDKFGAAIRNAFATLSNFNISIGVTDKFMHAVVDDVWFDLPRKERLPIDEVVRLIQQDHGFHASRGRKGRGSTSACDECRTIRADDAQAHCPRDGRADVVGEKICLP